MKFVKLSLETSAIDANEYVYNVRIILAAIIGAIIGFLPKQSIFYILPLLLAIAYPIRQIELKTNLVG